MKTSEWPTFCPFSRFEDRLANIAVGIGSALLVFLLTNGCSRLGDMPSTPAPVTVPSPTWTAVPTPEPTSTPTVSPTPTQTGTPAGNQTPTPIGAGVLTILEVTSLGGAWSAAPPKPERLDAAYTPRARQNVRQGPGTRYPVRYRLSAGQTIGVYAWVSNLPEEAWLCLDAPVDGAVLCAEAVALVYGGREYGELEIDAEVK